MTFIVTQIE